ncbi:hypothetical protein FSP39_015577 [Pinctada imbricata]|uniref:Assembly chaperone of rpl4 n=1 Tax=Pinctada imbricata TaxID=66713 RepID=A0AA89BX85_PINIB|nr:hypothetical protein FSP39_015577 [Pinctada imbricata]
MVMIYIFTSLIEDRRKILQQARKEVAREASGKKATPTYSVDQLLDKAEECIDRFEYEVAQKFCQRALEQEADNVRALETSGNLLLELGNNEAAKQCFGRAVEVSQDVGYSKYMTLGQLMEGSHAVQCFQKGIELMVAEREKQSAQELSAACGDHEEDAVSDKDISNAYCAVAEIYMTDLCFEEEAEVKCENAIKEAIKADSNNSEALQLMASFYLSKEKKEDAKEMIVKSVSLWLSKIKAMEKGEITDKDAESVEDCIPGYDSRLSAAKILIEVEEFETSIDVLECLLDENEDIPQVWYTIGWANYLQGEDYKANARFYLNKCKKIYTKVKCEDGELLKHVEELLLELGPGDEDDDEEGGDVVGEDGADLDIDSDNESETENMEH